ncbi:MAG: redoxin domain-containing protein, partial [bacterium]|nr:redoxin domain-containing protein [bacterium]
MTKNNNRSTYILVGLLTLAVIFIGYLLMRNEGPASPRVEKNASLNDLLDKPMPGIKLADKDGREVSIESYKGKNVVLFFSEGLMCYPACWDQIAAFGNDERFNTDNT